MALSLAGGLREKGPEVLALRRLGRAARGAGRLDEAWSWYGRSHDLAVEARDAEGEVIACQGLGNVCDDRGERDLAREWWERGLARAAGLGTPQLEWPLLLEHGDAAAAEAVFREGLEGAEGHWALTLRVNLGESLLRQGRLLEAEDEARRAEELAVVQRMVPDLVDVYALLGSIARERCDGEGFVFYEEALRVCHERALPRKREAALLHGYGLLHLSCGRAEEGRGYLEAARDVYRLLGFAPELGRVEEALGRLSDALVL